MTLGQRIAERMEVVGISQAELARRVGISQPSVNALLYRNKSGSTHIHKIARELGTTPAYLTGETDDPNAGALPAPSPATVAEQLGLAMIPEVDISYGLGGTFLEEQPKTTMVPFRADWLRRLTRGSPADVFLTHGKGDSMIPTILDGDDVLVNRSERVVRDQDLIWALGYGEVGQIKRVRRLAGGAYQLNSDNPSVRPIEATEDELFIVGRVIWIGRRM